MLPLHYTNCIDVQLQVQIKTLFLPIVIKRLTTYIYLKNINVILYENGPFYCIDINMLIMYPIKYFFAICKILKQPGVKVIYANVFFLLILCIGNYVSICVLPKNILSYDIFSMLDYITSTSHCFRYGQRKCIIMNNVYFL